MTELLSVLIGALAGAGAAAFLYTREARRAMKIDVLRRFVSNRFDTSGEQFTQVLNEILVIFADSGPVLVGVEDLARGSSGDKLVALYRAMADAARIKHKAVSDDVFLTAFNVRHSQPPPPEA